MIVQSGASRSRGVDTFFTRTLSARQTPMQITVTYISKSDSNNYFVCEGTVCDSSTAEHLVGVNVLIVDSKRGIATDQYGRFKLDGLSPNDTLLFQYIGIKSKRLSIHSLLESTKSIW